MEPKKQIFISHDNTLYIYLCFEHIRIPILYVNVKQIYYAMKISSKYKRFKRINFASNTYTLLDVRSLIIHTIERCNHYPNTVDLRRSEKQAQINKIDTQKTVRTLSISDRAFWLFLHLIFEMEKHFPNYYSYEQKYHKLTSMNIHSYQCSNVYIVFEKWVSTWRIQVSVWLCWSTMSSDVVL